jgi:hypothetical protein
MDGQGPDNENVQGDDDYRPQRVVRNESEIRDRADDGHGDTHRSRPDRTAEQPHRGEDDDYPCDQVDPTPSGRVELENVVSSGDIELVLEDSRETSDRVERSSHEHHDGGKIREANGRTTPRIL